MEHELQINVNGAPLSLRCDTRDTLLYVLREHLGLTGSKEACGSGDCGACTVILDGQLVCSCLVLAAEACQAHVETIEGVRHGDQLHPVQQALTAAGAAQCGICTPGVVMSAKVLLDKNAAPTE